MKKIEAIKGTDIYLLDQIMKGTFQKKDKILDAGCGHGRNMYWFGKNGFTILGCDLNEEALNHAQQATEIVPERFKIGAVEALPYHDNEFDHVICNAVLHFAKSEEHFMKMINELYRVLKPNGILFIRMTSTFGLPKNYVSIGDGRFLLQDGSERFLLTKELLDVLKKCGFKQKEPVKSVLVEELRSMTTLVLTK